MPGEIPNKHILDTSAWNNLANDPDLEGLRSAAIVPTALAIAEIAATEDSWQVAHSAFGYPLSSAFLHLVRRHACDICLVFPLNV